MLQNLLTPAETRDYVGYENRTHRFFAGEHPWVSVSVSVGRRGLERR